MPSDGSHLLDGVILDAVLSASGDALIALDLDGRIQRWSSAAVALLGERDEAAKAHAASLWPPDRAGELAWMIERIHRAQPIPPLETVLLGAGGARVDVALRAAPIADGRGLVTGVLLVARDIRERLEQHRTAMTADARWRALIDSTVDGMIVIDDRGRIEAFNRSAERLFGYTADEVVGRNVSLLMPSPDREQHDGYLARYLETGVPRIIGTGREVVGRRRDGSTFPLHLSVGEMRIGSERHFTGILHDLSARALLRERWRALVDAAVDGIIVINGQGVMQAFNPAAQTMFGYTEEQALGRNVSMLMPSPDAQSHDHYLTRYLETGEQKIIGIGRDVVGLRSDGTRFPLHLSVGEMRMGAERHFVGILHDLSARARLEEQVREQTALARLGQMAAVLAHEVRNPLTAVRGAIQVIGKRLPADGRESGVIKEILARLDGLNDLMQDLLLYARTPKPKLAPVALRQLLTSVAELLGSDPALASVRVEVSGDAPPILGDRDLLTIALQNVILNAAQAMQGAGVVRATVTSVDAYQRVTIADAGPGIPSEVRERLFQPFFTTKARGTGLGLATVRRVVEAHGGHVTVECPPEGGTVVAIELAAEAAGT